MTVREEDFKRKNTDGSVEIIAEKLLSLQVCTTLTDPEELAIEVNKMYPCGTTAGWGVTDRPALAPVTCAENADRRHVILDA